VTATTRHTIVALVEDHPGVLHRAVSLFRRRGYNIESLTVGPSEVAGASRMTLVVEAKDAEQVVRQFNRLIEVLMVKDVTNQSTVERETALMKIDARAADVAGVIALAHAAGARVVDVSGGVVVVEVTDAPTRIESFIDTMRPLGIRELMRTGRLAMTRGAPAHASAAPTPRHAGATSRHGGTLAHEAALEPLPFRYQADGVTEHDQA
jgi:acetolactate synthase I/III small subunit